MRVKKLKNQRGRYIPLSDIEQINGAFLMEMERVKRRLGYVKDEAIIKAFQEVLLNAYTFAIEVKTLECKVDYDIKLAKIEQKERNQKPWRRCWLWRLLFQPLTNRAQDIIEERAELEADIIHSEAEKEIEDKRKARQADDNADSDKKLSKRKLKRRMRDKLKAAIRTADNTPLNEVFTEPENAGTAAPQEQEKANTAAVMHDVEPAPENAGQLPGQVQFRLDELTETQARRPRPPRSCRRPATPGQ